MQNLSQPLTNVQLEILRAFSFHLDKEELGDFKECIAQYFAQRAINAANKVWDKKGWNDQDVDKMLNTKMRKSSPKK